jgi:O-antigen/teichoic acid export membrane protein
VLDVGLSSLATFVVGVYAARHLDPVALGAYAFVFAVFTALQDPTAQLVFAPVEIGSLAVGPAVRFQLTRQSLPMGAAVSSAATLALPLLVYAWLAMTGAAVSWQILVALVVTAMANTIVSPLQDHLRNMHHLCGSHLRAARVSLVQLAVVSCAIAAAIKTRVPPPWVPFGSLALANLTSGAFAWQNSNSVPATLPKLKFRQLVRQGKYIFASGAVPSVAGMVVSALLTRLAGIAILGYLEAARVAAQPLSVLSKGISAVGSPRAMQAACDHDPPRAKRVAVIWDTVLIGFAICYALAIGWRHPLNPLMRLVPAAFVIPGLVLARIGANLTLTATMPFRMQLLATRKEKLVAKAEAIGNLLRIAATTSAAVVGAFAEPIGLFIQAISRIPFYSRGLKAEYGNTTGTAKPVATIPLAEVASGAEVLGMK